MTKSTCSTFEQFVKGLAHFPETLADLARYWNLHDLYLGKPSASLDIASLDVSPNVTFTILDSGQWEANTLIPEWDEVPKTPFMHTASDTKREFFIRRSASQSTWAVKLINGASTRISSKDMEAMAELCTQYLCENVRAG